MRKSFFFPAIVALAILMMALAGIATPALARSANPDWVKICANQDGLVFNKTDRLLPEKAPCAEGTTYEVSDREYPTGTYKSGSTWPLSWNEVTKSISGKIWAHPQNQEGWTVSAPATQPAVQVVAPGNTEAGICAKEASREARLDCATRYYFQNGEKLPGIVAALTSMGITWDKLEVTDPFQPDAVVTSTGPSIWGALVLADNVQVSGVSCLVTDVPSRLGSYGWSFIDNRYNPKVYHVGNANSIKGQMVEMAVHFDCTDWPELLNAMNGTAVVSTPAVPATPIPTNEVQPGWTPGPEPTTAGAQVQPSPSPESMASPSPVPFEPEPTDRPITKPVDEEPAQPIDWGRMLQIFLLGWFCCGLPIGLFVLTMAWIRRPHSESAPAPNATAAVVNGAASALGIGGLAKILTGIGDWFKTKAPEAGKKAKGLFGRIWSLIWGFIKLIGKIVKFLLLDWWIWILKKIIKVLGCAFWIWWWVTFLISSIGAIVLSIVTFPIGLLSLLIPVGLILIAILIKIFTPSRPATQPATAPAAPTP